MLTPWIYDKTEYKKITHGEISRILSKQLYYFESHIRNTQTRIHALGRANLKKNHINPFSI